MLNFIKTRFSSNQTAESAASEVKEEAADVATLSDLPEQVQAGIKMLQEKQLLTDDYFAEINQAAAEGKLAHGRNTREMLRKHNINDNFSLAHTQKGTWVILSDPAEMGMHPDKKESFKAGKGCFGTVKYGLDTKTQTPVAIKLCNANNDDENLKKEIKLLRLTGQLRGAYSRWDSEIQDTSSRHGSFYEIVMDLACGQKYETAGYNFIENNPLHHFDEPFQKKSMSPQEVIGITRSLLESLKVLHDAGWVHRDIKPDNVFLKMTNTKEGVRWKTKIIDFGAAEKIDKPVKICKENFINKIDMVFEHLPPERRKLLFEKCKGLSDLEPFDVVHDATYDTYKAALLVGELIGVVTMAYPTLYAQYKHPSFKKYNSMEIISKYDEVYMREMHIMSEEELLCDQAKFYKYYMRSLCEFRMNDLNRLAGLPEKFDPAASLTNRHESISMEDIKEDMLRYEGSIILFNSAIYNPDADPDNTFMKEMLALLQGMTAPDLQNRFTLEDCLGWLDTMEARLSLQKPASVATGGMFAVQESKAASAAAVANDSTLDDLQKRSAP